MKITLTGEESLRIEPVVRLTVAGEHTHEAIAPSIGEPGRRYTVIYDGHCKVCGRMVTLLTKWDRGHDLEIIPSQASGVRERFPWIPAQAYVESLQVIRTRDGRTWQAAASLEELLNVLPKGRLISWLFRIPFVRPLADRFYRWFARNRYKLGCGNHCAVAATGDPEILEDRSVSMEGAVLYLFALAGPLVLLQAAIFAATWEWTDLRTGLDAIFTLRIGGPIFILGVLLHELLHGVGWKVAGAIPWRAIRFGFQSKTFTPYAHSRLPLSARAYRIGTVLPALVLGAVPYGIGLVAADGRLAAFGMLFTFVAGGDLAILWLLRGVPSNAWVQDHTSRAGCHVVAPRRLSGQ